MLPNYKTVLGKEEALQNVIDGEIEEGLANGPFFSLAELNAKYPNVLLNSLGGGIEDLAKSDVGMSNDADYKTKSCRLSASFRPSRRTDRIKNRRNARSLKSSHA